MQRIITEVGATVWIAMGNENLSEGKVILRFRHHNEDQYVIEVKTHIDPILEVRCGFTLSDSKDLPIGMWRR
jgi:hypothetical protein